MSQITFRNRNILVVCLMVTMLLSAAQASAHSSGASSAQTVQVQGQPVQAPLHLEATFGKNVLIGTLTVSDKDGRPWIDVRGQASLLDSSGQRLATIPLQPLAPGEFRLIVPLSRLSATGYLDVQLPGHGQAAEQRGVYEINPASRTVAWAPTAPRGPDTFHIQATGGPDTFGYTWDDTATYNWVSLTAPTSVSLRDDDYVGPLSIGFTFNFYGKSYTQFYIDSNGFLSFADNVQSYYTYGKYGLPIPSRPNNVIAPFWEDFNPELGGAIRYQAMGSAPNRTLVVEWQNVPSWGEPTNPQSFQAVLYESSNQILFQYPNTRSGTRGDLSYATVGIENDDGTIGLTYPYVIPVGSTRAVLFSYTRPAYNVFLTPERQGSSAAAGASAAFHVLVKNLGSSADAYTMSRPAYTGSDWTVGFYQSDGVTPLAGNSTGSIASSAQKDIVVKVSVPGGASVGNWTRATVQATSQANGAVQDTATVDVVLTPSFYQAYVDDDSGDGTEDLENYAHPIVDGTSYARRLTTDKDNSNYAGVAATPDGNAVTVWNTNYWNSHASVSDIQYAIVNRNGSFVRAITRLTNNSAATLNTYDFSPAVAVAPNGNILVDWAKQVDTNDDGSLDRFDAWYTIVSSSGATVKAPTPLTSNASNYPRDYPPSVVALTGGNFLLTWEHGVASSGPWDIYYTVLDSNGNTVKGVTQLTDGTGLNGTPRAAAFPNGKAAIVWTLYNSYWNGEIYYAVLNADGTSPSTPTPITSNGASASSMYADAAALSDGQLAVAWTQWTQASNDLQIQYTIITLTGQAPTASFISSSPDTLGETTFFTNTTTGTEPITYLWNFGDGGTSTLKNPTHAYGAAGTYNVSLTASNSYGTSPFAGTVQITSPGGWTTIVSEDFEGSFPGTTWQVFDNDGTTNGEYYWAKKSCKSYAGGYSGWAIGGGANGAALSCGANYSNRVSSWMVHGPFSLAGATAADLKFKLWLNSELNYDRVCRLASIDGSNFSGSCISGSTSGAWVDQVLDLSNVYSLGNLLGQPNVWVALIFVSDVSNTYPEGAYVDNIVLRKCTSASCPGANGAVTTPDDGQVVEFTTQVRLPGTQPVSTQVLNPSMPQVIYTVPNELSEANIYVSLVVSPTADQNDLLIMTWLDSTWYDPFYGDWLTYRPTASFLFYALANKTGANLTPATILQRTRRSYLWSSWNGYGNAYMPPQDNRHNGPYVVYLPVVLKGYPLPPPCINCDFEKGSLEGWTKGGSGQLDPKVVSSPSPVHGGSHAAVVGWLNAPCQGTPFGDSFIAQSLQVPATSSPQLSLWYRIVSYDRYVGDKYDWFGIYINGALTLQTGHISSTPVTGCASSPYDTGWQQFIYDLSPYVGQTIELRLMNHTSDSWYNTWTYIDDVSVQ